MVYELRLLWHPNPDFYAISAVFIGDGGGLEYIENTGYQVHPSQRFVKKSHKRGEAPDHFRERRPGLIRYVLTVLVFLFWVLLLPRPSPSCRNLRLCPWAWASILLHEPLDICLDLLPAAPPPPVQKWDTQHMFLQHRGAQADHWTEHSYEN